MRGDGWVGLALFAVAGIAVVGLPNNLGVSDESLILYESTRALHGEVLYRDVFEIITPGSLWLFAGLFHVFGATLGVARAAMAVVHALIVVLIFATCRGLGVRRELAAAAALVHLVIGQPAWPYASPHWMGTLLQVAMLWLAAARPLRGRAATAAAIGLAVGGLIMVQQQKGAVMAVAAALWLGLDVGVERRLRGAASWRALLGAELACAAAALAVVAPALALTVARAGVEPVLTALVRYPLHNYPSVVSASWGHVDLLNVDLASHTFPTLLAYLPVALLPVAVRAVAAWRRREDALRGLVALLAFAGAVSASIGYFPDFIHIAFIAPIFLVALAAALDWLLGVLPEGWRGAAPAVLASVVLAALAAQLARNWQRAWAEYPVIYQSPFGRIDLADQRVATQNDRVRALLDASPTRELLAYPGLPAVYLMTGANNPTPYQLLSPAYNGLPTVQAAIDTLERRQVPLVVIVEPFVEKNDPLVAYVREHYEHLDDAGVYRRR
jgi:hypothetical protein